MLCCQFLRNHSISSTKDLGGLVVVRECLKHLEVGELALCIHLGGKFPRLSHTTKNEAIKLPVWDIKVISQLVESPQGVRTSQSCSFANCTF